MKQVDKSAYDFSRYVGLDRWSSYHYQLREVLATKPTSVLEIGVGDRVVGRVLAGQGIAYTCADIAEDLKPDVVADVTALPFPGNSFDTVCAFEVLEHLPFDRFETAARELARVARRYVVISLPHFGPPVKFSLKLPFLPEVRLAFKIPYFRAHRFDGQHYWEIGKRGYPPRRVRAILGRLGSILEEFVPFENQYHHFFVIEKKP